MTTNHKNILIPGSTNKPILLDAFFIKNRRPKPVVIFSHGFKGFKDWGHFNLVAETAAEQGLVFVKFNFSHNGTTPEDPENFGDLEAFGNNNYLIELNDLAKVIDWVLADPLLSDEVDREKIYLLGHSRGGGISILKAADDKRVKKLATWASVSDLINRNKKKTVDTWKRDGVVYTHNARTGQNMPLYLQFYNTMMANRSRLHVLKALKSLEIPVLIAHGTGDEAVPLREAEILHRTALHSQLLIIEGASHTFGARHPWTEKKLPAHAAELLTATIAFFKK